ncbi:MAG: hypothetical protein H6585_10275 [Flavobacteriales bacterium]|nr:hypothetical protein [Flavobacteriales bacterium]MCB9448717.1 hypothetical protein [Flavobacteriales bacterium]
MKPVLRTALHVFLLLTIITGCKKKDDDETPPDQEDTWDIDTQGIPQFVTTNYIGLDSIYRISKFRSSVGHDYSDAFEHCRSMKHYFEPLATTDWSALEIVAPVAGTITRADVESMGTKLEIQSDAHPAFRFQIFHIQPARSFAIGDHVNEGETLGHHYGNQTYSDIAVLVNDPTKQGRLVSYFDVMSETLFQQYIARGATTRDDFIISKALRDAHPLDCNNFGVGDTLEPWVVLQ